MAVAIGSVVRLEDIDIDFSLDRIFETPPFPTWTESRYSRERLEAPVERLAPEVEAVIAPRAMYRVLPTHDTDLRSHAPPEPLLEAPFVATLVATVGDMTVTHPEAEPVFDEMIRDALENAALTMAKEAVALEIRDAANEEGWKTTRLFSPGSGNVDWPVEHSTFVFGTLPAEDIGVSVTPDGLLKPNKSICSVIGLGERIDQAPDLFTCAGCPKIPDCPYARFATDTGAES